MTDTNDADLTIAVATVAPGVHRVEAAGEIDSSNCDRLRERLAAAADGGEVEVDLARVGFMDSSGLRALLLGRDAVSDAGGSLRVIRASDTVRRLLDITGLAEHLSLPAS